MQVVRKLTLRDGGECDKFRARQVDAKTCLEFPQFLRGLNSNESVITIP